MKINDSLNINDSSSISLKGIITLFDENTGKIILKVNNLIVKTGRNLIFKKILSNEVFDMSDLKIVFGYDSHKTSVTENDVYDKLTDYGIHTDSSNGITLVQDGNSVDNEKLNITFTGKFTNPNNNTDSNKLNWIGLATSDNTLFSRALFNTLIVPPTRSITINYTINF